jgi:hypothetical protein
MRTSGTSAALLQRLRGSRASTVSAVLVLSTLVTLLGACSSGPGARAWAAEVCTVLSPWRTEISTLTSRTQQQMTAETTPAQAKENLSRLFRGAENASEVARAGVERAGVPDVDQGKDVAAGFITSLGAMRDAYGRARSGIDALDTSPPDAFYTNVRSVVQTLNTEYSHSELDTSRLDSVELKQAFDEAPECS